MAYPDFSFEKRIWKKGYKIVAGLDEVGRGALAGPVVGGCVVFDKNFIKEIRSLPVRIDDSKKLTPLQRIKANKWIRKNSLGWGIGSTPATLINKIGISKATNRAFRLALKKTKAGLGKPVDFLLIDAFFIPYTAGLPSYRRKRRQLPIVHGDTKSISIAAASIIAKVYRDKLMSSLSSRFKYKKYGWEKNKGYGTKIHQKAIKKFGINRYHRLKFVRNFVSFPSR